MPKTAERQRVLEEAAESFATKCREMTAVQRARLLLVACYGVNGKTINLTSPALKSAVTVDTTERWGDCASTERNLTDASEI